MKVRSLLLASLLGLGLLVITAPAAHALTIHVGGGTIVSGQDSSAVIVSAGTGTTLTFTIQLNSAAAVDAFNGTASAIDIAEISKIAGSSVMLITGQNFTDSPDSVGNVVTYPVGSDGAAVGPTQVQLFSVQYLVTAAVTDSSTDFTFTIAAGGCATGTGACPGTPGSATVRVDAAVPEPATLLLLGSGLASLIGFGRKLRK